ncbi:hypothetical protein YC2023_016212 [Brassica napus]
MVFLTGMTGGGRNFSFLRLIWRRSATLILRRSLGCGPTRLVSFLSFFFFLFYFSKRILLFDLFWRSLTSLCLFVEPFGSAPMTPELRGLIATLRWDSPRWLALTVDRIRAAYALPPGENRATPVGSVVPVRPGKGHRDKSKLIFFCLGRFECLCVAQFAKYVLFKGE